MAFYSPVNPEGQSPVLMYMNVSSIAIMSSLPFKIERIDEANSRVYAIKTNLDDPLHDKIIGVYYIGDSYEFITQFRRPRASYEIQDVGITGVFGSVIYDSVDEMLSEFSVDELMAYADTWELVFR